VKIVLDDGAAIELRPGMSVIPTVETLNRDRPAKILAASRTASLNPER
jgi:hypothetical protein